MIWKVMKKSLFLNLWPRTQGILKEVKVKVEMANWYLWEITTPDWKDMEVLLNLMQWKSWFQAIIFLRLKKRGNKIFQMAKLQQYHQNTNHKKEFHWKITFYQGMLDIDLKMCNQQKQAQEAPHQTKNLWCQNLCKISDPNTTEIKILAEMKVHPTYSIKKKTYNLGQKTII